MNSIPSLDGVFLYAIGAFVLFNGIPLIRYLVRKHNKTKKEEPNAK